jgi:hypothetical protein
LTARSGEAFMSEPHSSRSLFKRLAMVVAGIVGIVLVCVFSAQLCVNQMFRGIATSRATGLAAWNIFPSFNSSLTDSQNPSISRSAELQSRTTSFDNSVSGLYRSVERHHGYFEDLRTENRSGQGRALAASFTVPASELDDSLNDLKALGRVQQISVASEDSTVRASRTQRRVEAAKNNLARLQSLRAQGKAGIQDALALQKEIAKATDDLAQIENEQQSLLSTVSRASVRFALIEEYRATLDVDLAGELFQLRNSLFEGLSGILATSTGFLAALFEYGLPVGFWGAILFYPTRLVWNRIRRFRAAKTVSA